MSADYKPAIDFGVKSYRDSGGPILPPGQKEAGKGRMRCSGCGFRIRTKVRAHELGPHHRGIRNGKG